MSGSARKQFIYPCSICNHTCEERQCEEPSKCCDYCDNWVHLSCDNISAEDLCYLDGDDHPYKCSICLRTDHGPTYNFKYTRNRLVQMVCDRHPFVAQYAYSSCSPLPFVQCHTKGQVRDFKSFISSGEGSVCVDTISSGQWYITTAVCIAHNVTGKETGEPPICLGPLMLHWDRREQSYFRFFAHLQGILRVKLQNVELLMGTDNEIAMTEAINMVHPGCKRKTDSNVNTDSLNHRLKVLIGSEPIQTEELIEILYDLVKIQRVDFRRATYGITTRSQRKCL